MRLLVISSVLPPFQAGEADYALRLCEKLLQKGWQIDLLTNQGTTNLPFEGIKLHAIMKDWSWKVGRQLRSSITPKRTAPSSSCRRFSLTEQLKLQEALCRRKAGRSNERPVHALMAQPAPTTQTPRSIHR